MIHLFLATGFEEIETITILDVLRRCGLEVKTVSVTGTRMIVGAHGIPIMADALFRRRELDVSEAMILPGGMPGTKNLSVCDSLNRMIKLQAERNGLVCAICAAPLILGRLGLLKGKKAICYPGFEDNLIEASITYRPVVEDGNIITANGPAAAMDFAFAIAARFVDDILIEKVRKGMMLQTIR